MNTMINNLKKRIDKMSKRNKVVLFILLFSMGTALYIAMAEQNNQEIIETGTSEYYGTETTGYKMVLNNVWGATYRELNSKSIESYVYVKSDGSLGWEWDRPDPRRNPSAYVPPIYPAVIIGATPANSQNSYSSSTTKTFPIRYGDINDWTSTIRFEYPKFPNGLYNLAYDIYWMNGDIKEFNVMIWIEGHVDGVDTIGEVTDGINTYIHYYKAKGHGSNWEWHGFELKNQGGSSHKVDIKKLLDNAFSQDTIDDDWIVPGIELGNEIWRGSGRIQIYKYDMVVNGDSIVKK